MKSQHHSTTRGSQRVSAALLATVIGFSGVPAAPVVAGAAEQVGTVAASSQTKVQNATMKWGVKQSFRQYIKGLIAKGSWSVSGVKDNNGVFAWSQGTGTLDSAGRGTISFPGSVRFTGHDGILDMTLKNVRLKIVDAKHGQIVADIDSRPFESTTKKAAMKHYAGVEFADVDLASMKRTASSLSVSQAPVSLTAVGNEAFAKFYGAGQALDPLSFTAKTVAAASTPKPTASPTKAAPKPAPSVSKTAKASPKPVPSAPKTAKATPKPAPSAARTTKAVPRPSATRRPASTAAPSAKASVSGPAATAVGSSSSVPKASAAAPKQQTTSVRQVASGTMSWGVKESFRKYIKGPIANGSWTVSGVSDSNGIFGYGNASGFYDPSTRTGQICYPGTVHFTGHQGILDMKFTNMRVQITHGKGTLVADVDSRPFVDTTTKAPVKSYKNVVLGNVDLSKATLTGSTLSVRNAAVALTSKGNEAFTGFYSEGTAMDPMSFTARLGSPVKDAARATLDAVDATADSSVSNPMSGGAATGGSGESSGSGLSALETSSSGTDAAGSLGDTGTTAASGGTEVSGSGGTALSGSGSSTDPGHADVQCVPVTVTETATAPASAEGAGSSDSGSSQGTLSAGTMAWSVKTSFRNYISGGIAKGKWSLSQVTYSNGNYNWSNGTGTYKDGKGSISFPGTVQFTGHKGILNTKLSNMRLDINGKSGALYATVSSNNMEGKNKDYGTVEFADVNLSGLSTSGGKISVSGATTKLSQTGADAFANFYEAGQVLDPLSFSATVSGGSGHASTKAAAAATPRVTTHTEYKGAGCGSLASTGAHQLLVIARIGLGIIALGSGAVLVARRRRKGTTSFPARRPPGPPALRHPAAHGLRIPAVLEHSHPRRRGRRLHGIRVLPHSGRRPAEEERGPGPQVRQGAHLRSQRAGGGAHRPPQ